MSDPSPEIYAAMDRAKLSAGHLVATRKPMSKIVSEIRTALVGEIKELIERREQNAARTTIKVD